MSERKVERRVIIVKHREYMFFFTKLNRNNKNYNSNNIIMIGSLFEVILA